MIHDSGNLHCSDRDELYLWTLFDTNFCRIIAGCSEYCCTLYPLTDNINKSKITTNGSYLCACEYSDWSGHGIKYWSMIDWYYWIDNVIWHNNIVHPYMLSTAILDCITKCAHTMTAVQKKNKNLYRSISLNFPMMMTNFRALPLPPHYFGCCFVYRFLFLVAAVANTVPDWYFVFHMVIIIVVLLTQGFFTIYCMDDNHFCWHIQHLMMILIDY